MSATRRQKLARQAEHKRIKAQKEREKLFASAKPKKREFVEYKMETPYVRETKQYPSLTTSNSIPESCSRPEPKRYTGTLVKGIATMHKSNAVPVISQQEAEDISKMRRN